MKTNVRIQSSLVVLTILYICWICCGCQKGEEKTGVKPQPFVKPVISTLLPQYTATLAEGIDFTKEGYPEFLSDVSGMSDREPWGRWTDANLSPTAKFVFKNPLPRKFTLELKVVAFGPNIGQPVKVIAGGIENIFTVKEAHEEVFHLLFNNVSGNTIEIIPPIPTVPKEIGANQDIRKLGVGIVYMKIVE
ncbi:MAG: hypothetical protein N2171_04360 [Clostridia bacterium]|nr:hypothetical protein [Clostridia bacterium]